MAEGTPVVEDSLAEEGTPVATKHILVEMGGNLVVGDIPVVGTLEEASAVLRSRIVAARVDHN